MKTEYLVLAGERVPAADGKAFSVIEPGQGEPFVEVAEAGREDILRAVQIAYKAFEEGKWPRLSATQRGRVLLKTSTLLRERLEDIAVIEARNAGKPISDARDGVGLAAAVFEYWGGQRTRFLARPSRYKMQVSKSLCVNLLACAGSLLPGISHSSLPPGKSHPPWHAAILL